ncbi:MAG: thioredoxin family protein [Ignavibacteriae bacterium]|nr:thioredoxin family protein [Ignavibacteriota bacterium]
MSAYQVTQLGLGSQIKSSESKARVESELSVDNVQAGSHLKVALLLTIEAGWHVNSHTPSEDYLIGTALDLLPKDGIIVSDISYPKGKLVKLAFADEALDVYEGTVPIFLSLKLSEKTQPGLDTVRGKLRVQACNDQVCLAPGFIDVGIPLNIVPVSTKVQSMNDSLFSSYVIEGASASTLGSNEIARIFETQGFLLTFVAIFLIGLALNLTPCVYPMLSITVSLFGGQSDTNTLRVFFKAVVYVLGMATMYSVLGVTAALGGGIFGGWLQSLWVLGGIAVLLFGLALSSFGLYQLQMPYWLTSRLGGTTGTGIISLYLSGLVVGVFAAPCIGPPIIALLAFVGAKGDPLFGFWTFFILSLGLGFPYLILGTFSGMLKKIPRSGVWLVWVERIFGVVLMGASLFYLSLALFPKLTAYVIPVTLIAGGIYLGFIERSGKENKVLQKIQWGFGLVAVVFGVFVFSAFLEPGVSWEKYSVQKIAEAKKNQLPVVIDFYADWCIPCLELDRKTFTDAQVIAVMKEFVRLKVDLTHFDLPESEELRKQYKIAGVPTIVFLDRDGEELSSARVIGYLPPHEFTARMKNVLNGSSL